MKHTPGSGRQANTSLFPCICWTRSVMVHCKEMSPSQIKPTTSPFQPRGRGSSTKCLLCPVSQRVSHPDALPLWLLPPTLFLIFGHESVAQLPSLQYPLWGAALFPNSSFLSVSSISSFTFIFTAIPQAHNAFRIVEAHLVLRMQQLEVWLKTAFSTHIFEMFPCIQDTPVNQIEIFQPLQKLKVHWERKQRHGLVSVTRKGRGGQRRSF